MTGSVATELKLDKKIGEEPDFDAAWVAVHRMIASLDIFFTCVCQEDPSQDAGFMNETFVNWSDDLLRNAITVKDYLEAGLNRHARAGR